MSTTDQIFYIHQTLEKKWEYNGTVYQLFTDLKKAYDSVRMEVLGESRVVADTLAFFRFSCILNIKEQNNYCINYVLQYRNNIKNKLHKKTVHKIQE
jgi:hypothetical protein